MSGDAGANARSFILALDIGTTNVRCLVVNSSGIIAGKAHQKIKLYHPQPGWVEINPDELYTSILEVVYKSVEEAKISFVQVKSLGISTHRASFLTWTKDSGEYLHNFITWQDKRTEQLVKDLNASWLFFCFRGLSSLLYRLSKTDKFKMARNFNLTCVHVSSRLLWVLSNIDKVQEALKNNNLMFGTLDTWILYKLTNGRIYVTDISNASATGFFDLFSMSWGVLPLFLKIPTSILPKVVGNDYLFGETSADAFGQPLSIGCVMGDQMASMFGSGCYNKDDLKITIGTGAFLDVNTGNIVHPCLSKMYPLIGWKIYNDVTYILEIPCMDSGSVINWLQQVGLISDLSETSDIAFKVPNNHGVIFLPDMNLQFYNNSDEAFIGMTSITQGHKIRAVLESIVYKIVLSYQLLLTERRKDYSIITVDGGVAKNDFICQLLADLTNISVRRMVSSEMSSMGAAYIAGLTCRLWSNIIEIQSLQVVEKMFCPYNDEEYQMEITGNFQKWLQNLNQ